MPSISETVDDVHLFVLAHADDEIAFAPLLKQLVEDRETVRLIYLTDGAGSGTSPARRAVETFAALENLCIEPAWVSFAGTEIGIPDGELHRHLDRALAATEEWGLAWRSVCDVYSLAWEGGHPDHDSALVVAAAFAVRHDVLDHLWQVPFYRASDRLPSPLFTVGSPIAENGALTKLPLSARDRRLPVTMMRFYPSQWRSLVGLGPFLLWRSLTKAHLELQRLDPERLWARPTPGPLLYERRNGLSFESFAAAAAPFLEAHLKAGFGSPVRPALAETA